MYIVYLTKIAKIHIFQHLLIWPEVAGIMIFHQKWVLWVYLRLPETIVHYKSAFHGDFHIFEKNRFFQVQNLAKKNENRKFYREFVLESSDCFARGYFLIVPPNHPRKCIPTFTSHIIYQTLKFLKITPKIFIFGHSLI